MIVGEVLKGEGPLKTQDGIVLPFEYKGDSHRLALSNEEMNAIASRPIVRRDVLSADSVRVDNLGSTASPLLIKSHNLIDSDGGGSHMITKLYSLHDTDFLALVFEANRTGGNWSLGETVSARLIEHVFQVADKMAVESLEKALKLKKFSIKKRDEELFRRQGVDLSPQMYA